ncbi:hypothetical protein ACQPYH_04185 [Kribbella sp. CA-245084]|uniref:hypothetical protein n=1 Tax=Kribbella sp. CA-245084 TaxID=3239940 RepID=UPI003D8CDD35
MTTDKTTYAKVAARLGVAPDADPTTLLAAFDEVQAEKAHVRTKAAGVHAEGNEPAPPAERTTTRYEPPDGTVLVDAITFDSARDYAQTLDRFRAQVAERVGVDPTADPSVVLAAVEEALGESADTAEGVEVVDTAELQSLRQDAEQHRTARERAVVEAAVHDGRLRSFERRRWVSLLQQSPDAAAVLAGLPKGRVPVDGPIGYTGALDAVGEGPPDDDLDRLFGDDRR